MSTNKVVRLAAGALALGILAACNVPTDSKQNQNVRPSTAITLPTGVPGHLLVCKDGPAGTFGFTTSADPGVVVTQPTFNLTNGNCTDVADVSADITGNVTVTETNLAGANFVRTDLYFVDPQTLAVSFLSSGANPNTLFLGDAGKILVFVNEAPPPPGGCTFTKGYYRNHPAAVSTIIGAGTITVGGQTLTAAQAQAILNATPGKLGSITTTSNVLLNLVQQTITAILNGGLTGPASVQTAIANAQAAITIGANKTSLSSPLDDTALGNLITPLDDFNNGLVTGFPHCAD